MARTKGAVNKPRRIPIEEYFTRSFVGRRVFDALCASPYGRTKQQLVGEVYRGVVEPEWAQSSISVAICLFNRKAFKHSWGLRIFGHGGPGSKYLIYLVRDYC